MKKITILVFLFLIGAIVVAVLYAITHSSKAPFFVRAIDGLITSMSFSDKNEIVASTVNNQKQMSSLQFVGLERASDRSGPLSFASTSIVAATFLNDSGVVLIAGVEHISVADVGNGFLESYRPQFAIRQRLITEGPGMNIRILCSAPERSMVCLLRTATMEAIQHPEKQVVVERFEETHGDFVSTLTIAPQMQVVLGGALSRDGQRLVLVGYDSTTSNFIGRLELWDTTQSHMVETHSEQNMIFSSVAVSASDHNAICGTTAGTILAYDMLENAGKLQTIKLHYDGSAPVAVEQMSISNSMGLVAAVLSDKTVRVMNLASGREVWRYHVDHHCIVAFSNDGTNLAITNGNVILCWHTGSLN
jgi:WD40 repeat protein